MASIAILMTCKAFANALYYIWVMGSLHTAIYGSVSMLRGICNGCGGRALIIGGLTACCKIAIAGEAAGFIQEAAPLEKRRSPSRKHKKAQLDKQGGKCLYCDLEIGSYVQRKDRLIRLVLVWDHVVPFSYSRNNGNQNFVADCHICNSIKSDLMFGDLDEAKAYIISKRAAKGYM